MVFDSEDNWHRCAGDHADLGDDHANELGRSDVVDEVKEVEVLMGPPVGEGAVSRSASAAPHRVVARARKVVRIAWQGK